MVGSLKIIYECPLYYMGGWVRVESDGFGWEGRRGRWNFCTSRVANLQSFIISPVFSTVYVFSSNFFRYIDEVSESFFDFWK